MNFPPNYDESLFDFWYTTKVEKDIKIDNKIDKIRNDLAKYFFESKKHNGYDEPNNLWSLFYEFLDASLEHLKIRKKLNTIDYVPVNFPNNINEFQKHFVKSTKSIKNKLWRKNKIKQDNKERGNIKISDLTNEMKDLVRFSIKAGSLQIAEEMSKELANIDQIIKHDNIKKFYDNFISKIVVDSELKTPSGYFAYHIYFHFKKGYIVELQVYSELSNYWRNISHVIYEKIRLLPKKQLRFNDLDSRLISIGHLLYLADCELCNIEHEIELKE